MTVTEYVEKFEDLSHFAQRLVADELEKVEKFQEGFNYSLQMSMVGAEHITYLAAYNHAYKLAGVKGKMDASRQKRQNDF